uniref:Uncharacterized protein n=1 Tax=Oryza rufipogon TaxID=4529 RepID=A0A0E0PS09_ORYRU
MARAVASSVQRAGPWGVAFKKQIVPEPAAASLHEETEGGRVFLASRSRATRPPPIVHGEGRGSRQGGG